MKSRTHLQDLMLKIAIGVIALDLLTKVLAVKYLENQPNVVLIPAVFGESAGPLLQLTFIEIQGLLLVWEPAQPGSSRFLRS